jgi:hypothetical protein
MMKKRIFCFFCLVNLYACGEKSAKKPVVVAPSVMARPVFVTQTTVGQFDDDTPRTVVSIVWNHQTMVLDTMTGSFNPVDSSQYVRHRIPKTAIATGTGFWAGLETTFLIDSTATAWVVQRKYEDEEGDGKEPYETLKVLSFPK